MNLPALIVSDFLNWIVLILGLISFTALLLILYKIILAPALLVKAEQDAPPPRPGYKYELLIDDQDRRQQISVGQIDSTIKTRMAGIEEDQLTLMFHKDRGMEEYDIEVVPGNQLYYRPPHAKQLELLKDKESFAGRELIGHPALFRVAASVKDNRLLQFIEFELSTKYVFNNIGEEKMQFTLELTRIYPSLDEKSRDKKGLFLFGRLQKNKDEDDMDG